MIAVVLALGFSAFTTKPAVSSKHFVDLFWYNYDISTDQLNGQISTAAISHSTAKAATGCSDFENDVIDCARGYSEEQDPMQLNPGPGDDQVKRTDE